MYVLHVYLHLLQIGFHLGLKLFCELENHPLQQCEDIALIERYHNKSDGLVNWRAFVRDYVNLGKKAATCKKHAYILCTLCSDYGKCSKLSCKCEHAKSHRSGAATTLSTICTCGHMFSIHKINLHAQGVKVGSLSSATTSRHNLDKLLKHGELYISKLCQYDMSRYSSAISSFSLSYAYIVTARCLYHATSAAPVYTALYCMQVCCSYFIGNTVHISARLTCICWCSFECKRYYY
jgi:hypothetical protein